MTYGEGKSDETWNVRKWVEEVCCTVRADSIAERWKFSAIDASDTDVGVGVGVGEEDASPFKEDDESVSAIFPIGPWRGHYTVLGGCRGGSIMLDSGEQTTSVS